MIKSIDSQQLKTMLDSQENFTLIDCREQSEWDEAHIEAARFIPLSELESRVEEIRDLEEQPIVLQCRSGKRSMKACIFLQGEGFSNLTNLEDGILGWIENRYPVVNG